MKHLGLWLGASALVLANCAPALADPQGGGPGGTPGPAANTTYLDGCVYTAAGFTPVSGQQMGLSCDANGKLIVSASVSASVSGFTPSASGARGTNFTVNTTDSSGALPTGVTDVFVNTGANPIYCNVNGVAATTADTLLTASGGGWAPTIPAGITTLHCIATGGASTVNLLGGSGLTTTNWGGGSGGSGGGGSVTQGTSPWVDNITQIGGSSLILGSALSSGSIPVVIASDQASVSVKQATGTNLHAVLDTTSTTAVTQATGTNLHAVLDTTSTTAVTQATAANLNATVVGAGTAGTANANPVTVQGIASMTPVQVSQATAGNLNATIVQPALELAQASLTSGQKGVLIQGAVTTSAPTYTSAQTDPLSLDTAGNLRVNVVAGSAGNACSSATGSAVPAQGCFMAGGAAAGAGNQTGTTVKAASTSAASTDTALVVAEVPGSALITAVNAGMATPGSAILTGANTVQIGGTDGTNARVIATSTAGDPLVLLQTQTDTVMVGGVNVKEINAVTPLMGAGATGTGSQRVTAAQDTSTIAGSAPGTAGTASAQVVTVQGVTSMTPVQVSQVTASNLNAAVVGVGTAGSASGGVLTIQGVASMTPVQTTVNSGPCSGASIKSFIVAANTTSVAIDAAAGSVCGVGAYGVAAATPVWLKLYNIAQASTTCGTSAVTDRMLIATAATGNGAILSIPGGAAYSTAISACVTGGIADNDTTAPAATSYVVTIYYR